MSMGGTVDRSMLGFSEVVRSAFDFLEAEYGFARKDVAPTLVRYESSSVVISVYHGRSSYEVGVEISTRSASNRREPPFELADLVAFCGQEALLPAGFLQASTREAVRAIVRRAAEILYQCGSDLLRGDRFAFRRLDELRREQAVSNGLKRRLSDVRAAAATAWQEGDYRRVEALYRSIEPHLTPAERKKLDYVSKHENPHLRLRP